MPTNNSFKQYLLLHIALLLYAVSTIFMKLAATSPAYSFGFFAFYMLSLIVLAVYAFLWQKALNVFTLTKAYANKGIILLYGLVSGILFFGEKFQIKNVLAIIIVLIGIYLVISDEN